MNPLKILKQQLTKQYIPQSKILSSKVTIPKNGIEYNFLIIK